MPITPIEMISVAPKSQEASQYKHAESQKTFQEQSQIVQEFHKEVVQNSRQTVKAQKGENKEYQFDAREKGNGGYFGNSKKNKQQTADKKESEEIKLSNFDVKI